MSGYFHSRLFQSLARSCALSLIGVQKTHIGEFDHEKEVVEYVARNEFYAVSVYRKINK